ncbi:MAG: glycosyltransferase family 39 protein [Candidatus Omnitrophica bacterium]|nr:glycosyltransferase family 39 protein [Candidatus Omnitrophota bacterium]
MKSRIFTLTFLCLILAGAFLLRVYKIADKPVWYDEASSIAHAQKPLGSYLTSFRLAYKPVYFFMLNRWSCLFGEGAFYLRFFSLIWGVLTILLIYKLSSLIFDEETGLISAFILSISVFHIFHCQQIRQFSLVVFLATASFYYFSRYSGAGRIGDLLVLLLTNILLINTYPTGVYVVLVEMIFAGLYFREALMRHWVYAQVLLSVFIVRLALSLDQEHIKEFIWWIPRPSFAAIVETFHTLSWGGARYGLDDFKVIFPAPWLLWGISLSYLFFLWRGLRWRGQDKKMMLVVLWLALPVAAIFMQSLFYIGSFYSIKHLIIVLPAFCMLVARGIAGLKMRWRVISLAILFCANLVPLSTMYNIYFAPDWKSCGHFMRDAAKEGDALIVSPLHEVVPFMYYFSHKTRALADMDMYGHITAGGGYNSIFKTENDISIIGIKQSGVGDNTLSAENDFRLKFFKYGLGKPRSVWTVLMRGTHPDTRQVIFGLLKRSLSPSKCVYFHDIEVCHFEPASRLTPEARDIDQR